MAVYQARTSIFSFKKLFYLISFSLFGYFGWGTYHYLFDRHCPTVVIKGIEPEGWYAEDVVCYLEGTDKYKVSDISVWLDDKPLINKFKINAKQFSHPFTISTRSLPNGKHSIKAEVLNSLHKPQHTIMESSFVIDNTPLQAAFVKSDDQKVFQGRTLHMQFQVNKPIKEATVEVLSKSYPCFKEAPSSPIYECFIPVECEEPANEYPVNVQITDLVGNKVTLENKFQIVLYPFKRQSLKIDADKVQAEREAGISQQELEQEMQRLTDASVKEKLWHGSFIAPIEIQGISTEFGTIRVTQERGRYAHKAVDVLNVPRSVVWATQDGIVALKNRFEHSGNTVVIDHGHGVLSLFFHLDSFSDMKVGDRIKKGNPVGTLGKTGYASGYHLHWEMRVNNVQVDPMQWIKPNF